MDDIQNLISQEKEIKKAVKKLHKEFDEKEAELHNKYSTAMRELAERLNNKDAFIREQIELQKKELDKEIEQKQNKHEIKSIDGAALKKLEELLQAHLFASLKKN